MRIAVESLLTDRRQDEIVIGLSSEPERLESMDAVADHRPIGLRFRARRRVFAAQSEIGSKLVGQLDLLRQAKPPQRAPRRPREG